MSVDLLKTTEGIKALLIMYLFIFNELKVKSTGVRARLN